MFSRILSLACAGLISLTSMPTCGLVRAGVEDKGENSSISFVSSNFKSADGIYTYSDMFYNYGKFDWFDNAISFPEYRICWYMDRYDVHSSERLPNVVTINTRRGFLVYDVPFGKSNFLSVINSTYGSLIDPTAVYYIGLGYIEDFSSDTFDPFEDTTLICHKDSSSNLFVLDGEYVVIVSSAPNDKHVGLCLFGVKQLSDLFVSDSGLITWSGGSAPYTVQINGSSYTTSQTQYQIDLSSDPVQDYNISVSSGSAELTSSWQYVYTNGIINNLYNLIYGTLFKGELPSILTNVSEEVSAILTLLCILILLAGPCLIVFGFIKFIWYFADR